MRLLAILALVLLVPALKKAVEAEGEALLRALPDLVLRAASLLLPRRHRARHLATWRGDLDAVPDRPLTRLAWAFGMPLGALRVRWVDMGRLEPPLAAMTPEGDVMDPRLAKWFTERWPTLSDTLRTYLIATGMDPLNADARLDGVARKLRSWDQPVSAGPLRQEAIRLAHPEMEEWAHEAFVLPDPEDQ